MAKIFIYHFFIDFFHLFYHWFSNSLKGILAIFFCFLFYIADNLRLHFSPFCCCWWVGRRWIILLDVWFPVADEVRDDGDKMPSHLKKNFSQLICRNLTSKIEFLTIAIPKNCEWESWPILLAISREGSNQFRKAICHLKALNVL